MEKIIILFRQSLIIISIAIFHIPAYGQQANKPMSFTIEGTLTDILDNATVWLGVVEPYENKGMAFKGEVKNGAFAINGQTFQNTIGHLSLFVHGPDGKPLKQYPETPKIWFLLCEGRSTVFISDSFKTINIDCSCKNEQKKFEEMSKKLLSINNEIQLWSSEKAQAQTKKDTVAWLKASKEIKQLNMKEKSVMTGTIQKNKSSFLSLALIKNYFPLSLSYAEAELLFSKLSSRLKKSSMGLELQRQFELEKTPATTLAGKKFMDFTAQDSMGNKIKLSSFSGKWILLDFWAGWCGPCREAHPRLKELYSKADSNKFTIVSISIDNDRKRWLKAVADDKLSWPQLIDDIDPIKPGWYGKAFQLYKGNSIPLNFLISPEQTIEKVNISMDELERLLAKK